jgi:hypothetical protein
VGADRSIRRSGGKADEVWRKARGREVVIQGHLPETTTKGRAEEPRVLEVKSFAIPD